MGFAQVRSFSVFVDVISLHDARLRYFDGHSDTLGLFADPAFPRLAAAELAAPFRDRRGREGGWRRGAGLRAR